MEDNHYNKQKIGIEEICRLKAELVSNKNLSPDQRVNELERLRSDFSVEIDESARSFLNWSIRQWRTNAK